MTLEQLKKLYADATTDSWREEVRQKTDTLYREDPTCEMCHEPIIDRETATLVELANGSKFLLCLRPACQAKSLLRMVERYLDKPRRMSA